MTNMLIDNNTIKALRDYASRQPIYAGLCQEKSDCAFVNNILQDIIKFDRISQMIRGENV